MAWNWDSSRIPNRSYSAHHDLGQHLARIAPRQDWQAISVLFDRPSGDPFDIPPQQAAQMATAFKSLAPLAGEWSRACHDLAATANNAARNNVNWHWS